MTKKNTEEMAQIEYTDRWKKILMSFPILDDLTSLWYVYRITGQENIMYQSSVSRLRLPINYRNYWDREENKVGRLWRGRQEVIGQGSGVSGISVS